MTVNDTGRKDKLPTFFIVGAPKCGTTALYEYLKTHPDIFMAAKETHFFATDFPYRGVDNWDEYLKLYERSSDKHHAIGEASVWYLYSTEAIKNIYQFNNKAKIIAMLRNPIDMAYSLHSELVWSFDEDEKDFTKAWFFQEERKKGYNLPKHVVYPAFLQYAEVGKLGRQVERLLNVFPPEQIKFILFDDFKSSAKSVYEDVLSFLGVPSDGRTDFPRINRNKLSKFDWLGILIQRPPRFLVKAIRTLKYNFGLEQFWFVDSLHKLNTKTELRKPLNPNLKYKMLKEFNNDIDKLSRILNRDLSSWKN